MYHNISIDITKFEGTAIVNSLGRGKKIALPGAIFNAILAACKNPDGLKKTVISMGECLPSCSIFTTPVYGLPSENIIHVITPYKHEDPNNTQIRQCYVNILEAAAKYHYKSINVPLIGTGANGYDPDEVAHIARITCYQFAAAHPEIDIYFNVYFTEHSLTRQRFEPKEYQTPTEAPHQKESYLEKIGVEYGDSFAALIKKHVYSKIKGTKQEKEKALKDTWVEINALIGDYKTDEKGLEDTVNIVAQGGGAKYLPKGKATHAPEYEWKAVKSPKTKDYVWQRPNKVEILLTSIALKTTPEETLEIYEFCGYALSKYEKYDKAIRTCLNCLSEPDPWSLIHKTYYSYVEKSLTEYKVERTKVHTFNKD